MPTLHLETRIVADITVCFDLARSIDLHVLSTAGTGEEAVAGTTSGLIELGGSVTWRATHFGVRQTLTSHITAMERPHHFRDEQVQGAFTYIVHDHWFEQRDGHVLMIDTFAYGVPFGLLGKCFDRLVLARHMRALLTARNNVIKEHAESGKWRSVLPEATAG